MVTQYNQERLNIRISQKVNAAFRRWLKSQNRERLLKHGMKPLNFSEAFERALDCFLERGTMVDDGEAAILTRERKERAALVRGRKYFNVTISPDVHIAFRRWFAGQNKLRKRRDQRPLNLAQAFDRAIDYCRENGTLVE